MVFACLVCLPHLSTAARAAAGLLLWAWWAGDIDLKWQLPGAAAAWCIAANCSAANASSVMLSADVGSWTETC